jgi:hypothetical protein
VVHSKVIPEYEHLDVSWAMDTPEQVFKEVREVLWKTCNVRDVCRVPKGCEEVEAWVPPEDVGEEKDGCSQAAARIYLRDAIAETRCQFGTCAAFRGRSG